MHETDERLSELSDVMQRSADAAGAFLKSSFEVPADDSEAKAFDDHLIEHHGQSTNDWGQEGEGVYLVIAPSRIVTYRSDKADDPRDELSVKDGRDSLDA